MSDKWDIIEKQVTGQTQYVTARWTTSTGVGEGQLIATQASPVSLGLPTPGATTDAFDTSGYGAGVTLSYLIRTGTSVQIAFDTNNDITGLSLTTNQLLSSITQNVTDANPGTTIVSPTGGSGTGATMSIITSGGIGSSSITVIQVISQGSGYNVGDVLTIAAALLPGPPSNNILITLQEKDRDVVNASWVETILQPPISATVRNFVSSQDAHVAVRLRLANLTAGAPNVQQIRLMCAT
jgi:hypothetical protein